MSLTSPVPRREYRVSVSPRTAWVSSLTSDLPVPRREYRVSVSSRTAWVSSLTSDLPVPRREYRVSVSSRVGKFMPVAGINRF